MKTITRLPWKAFKAYERIDENTKNLEEIEIHSVIKQDPSTLRMICHINAENLACSKLNEEDKANAEFICKAVNNHEKLVAELKRLRDLVSEEDVKVIDKVLQEAE